MTAQSHDARLTPLGPCTWSDLRKKAMSHWLWMSMDPDRPLALEVELPQERPPGTTHVWGWSKDKLVRARVDRDLPGGGVLGALLALAEDPGGPDTKVRVDAVPGQTWDPLDGRVNADPSHPVFADRRLTRWTVTIEQEGDDGQFTLAPLTFLSLGS